MEPPDFEGLNFTVQAAAPSYPRCEAWRAGSECSVFHLAHMLLLLGFMGGSGFYGLLYLLSFLSLGFFCAALWSWNDRCSTDSFLWTFALFSVCVAQLLHVSYRLRSVSFDRDFQELYGFMFKKLGVSLTHFGKIVSCCEGKVTTLEKDHCFAVEGKTPIDKLSVLLSGRFPTNQTVRKQWEVPLRRDAFSATLHSRLCSEYFRQMDLDRTGQTVWIGDGVVQSVFNVPAHLKRPVATRTSWTSKQAVPQNQSVDCSPPGTAGEPQPDSTLDHSYALLTHPDALKARLSEAMAEVERLEREKRNAKD